MNPERRKFIKGALAAAGVVGGWPALKVLHSLGGESLVKEAQAANLFISGHAGGGGGGGAGTSYANWDGETESSLANGSDGANLWVVTCDGGVGANETGSSGSSLTGADLVWTQNNAIPAAVLNWRSLDGINMYFSWANNCADEFIASNTWSIISHINNYNPAALDPVFQIRDAANTNGIRIYEDAGGKMELWTKDGGVSETDASTSNAPGGDVWMGVFADGVNKIRLGWCAAGAGSGAGGQPTLWADFAANDTCEVANNLGSFNGINFTLNTWGGAQNLAQYPPIDVKTVILANVCLITM